MHVSIGTLLRLRGRLEGSSRRSDSGGRRRQLRRAEVLGRRTVPRRLQVDAAPAGALARRRHRALSSSNAGPVQSHVTGVIDDAHAAAAELTIDLITAYRGHHPSHALVGRRGRGEGETQRIDHRSGAASVNTIVNSCCRSGFHIGSSVNSSRVCWHRAQSLRCRSSSSSSVSTRPLFRNRSSRSRSGQCVIRSSDLGLDQAH